MPGLPARTALKAPWNKLRVGLCGVRDGELANRLATHPRRHECLFMPRKALNASTLVAPSLRLNAATPRIRARARARARSRLADSTQSIRLPPVGRPKRRERAARPSPRSVPSKPGAAHFKSPGAVNTSQAPSGLKSSLAIKPRGAQGRDAHSATDSESSELTRRVLGQPHAEPTEACEGQATGVT